MVLTVECNLQMSLIHKNSGKEFNIDKNIKKDYNEDSEEYSTLVEEYTDIIGFRREKDKNKFDEELLKIISDTMKKEAKEQVDNIVRVVKKAYEGKHAWVEFAGYVLNVQDFSGICISKFDTRISKH